VEKDINVSEVIKIRKYNLVVTQSYISILMRVIFLGLIGWFLFTQVFMIIRNTGMGMFPSIKDGDVVLAYRLEKDYVKEDVVVYEHEGTQSLGRIVAREGDIVDIDANGTLRVNGTIQSGEILYLTYAKEDIPYPYTVPEGNVFILGDYREQVKDSRDFGAVSIKDVEAKVITLLRRRGI